MEPEAFEALVVDALEGIPPELARHLENVTIVIDEEPAPALLRSLGLDPRRDTLFGLYQGTPLSQRSHDFAGALPDRITIFRGPLLRRYSRPDALQEQVRTTVVHEIAHFFGLDERRIRELGY